jgi:transcriptional regulator with XRE-family HTH domain
MKTSIELSSNELRPAKVKRRAAPARKAIERAGTEEILSLIRQGKSQREIARRLKVDVSTLNRFLRANADESDLKQAMSESSEAWLDRGMQTLERAKGGDSAEVARARAIALECARRAAIRNPKYSDRSAVELSGPGGSPVTSPQSSPITIYIPENNRD